MEIAIFGAGIAGLMSAITLRAQGHRCRIYERLRQGNESGMGFILMPEGADCLREFGVHLTGSLSGVPLHHFYYRNSEGEIQHEQTMPAGARGLRRTDLITALVRALPPDGAPVFEAELDDLEFNASDRVAAVRLSSGALIEADLYIAADGVGSRARQALFPDWPASPARVQEVVGMARYEDAMRWAGNNFNKFHAASGGIALGVLPIDAERLVWYLQFDSQRCPTPEESPQARRAFVQQLVGEWADPIPHLLAITDFSRVHVWRPLDVDPVPSFYRGNLVLIGDAAHPLHPFTSQGVSSAIADAVALAGVVHGSVNAHTSLDDALAGYSSRRRAQCAPYVAKGRKLTRQFLEPRLGDNIWLPIAQ